MCAGVSTGRLTPIHDELRDTSCVSHNPYTRWAQESPGVQVAPQVIHSFMPSYPQHDVAFNNSAPNILGSICSPGHRARQVCAPRGTKIFGRHPTAPRQWPEIMGFRCERMAAFANSGPDRGRWWCLAPTESRRGSAPRERPRASAEGLRVRSAVPPTRFDLASSEPALAHSCRRPPARGSTPPETAVERWP